MSTAVARQHPYAHLTDNLLLDAMLKADAPLPDRSDQALLWSILREQPFSPIDASDMEYVYRISWIAAKSGRDVTTIVNRWFKQHASAALLTGFSFQATTALLRYEVRLAQVVPAVRQPALWPHAWRITEPLGYTPMSLEFIHYISQNFDLYQRKEVTWYAHDGVTPLTLSGIQERLVGHTLEDTILQDFLSLLLREKVPLNESLFLQWYLDSSAPVEYPSLATRRWLLRVIDWCWDPTNPDKLEQVQLTLPSDWITIDPPLGFTDYLQTLLFQSLDLLLLRPEIINVHRAEHNYLGLLLASWQAYRTASWGMFKTVHITRDIARAVTLVNYIVDSRPVNSQEAFHIFIGHTLGPKAIQKIANIPSKMGSLRDQYQWLAAA